MEKNRYNNQYTDKITTKVKICNIVDINKITLQQT